MAKKRKRPGRKGPGRVTPKGTRPMNWNDGGPPDDPAGRHLFPVADDPTGMPSFTLSTDPPYSPDGSHPFAIGGPQGLTHQGGPPVDPDAEAEAIFDHLVEALETGPAIFLGEASTLASVADDRNRSPFERDEAESVDFAALIDAFADVASTETVALLLAFTALAPDQALRDRARAATTSVGARNRIDTPRWLRRLDRARATRAQLLTEPSGDMEQVMIEVALDDESVVGLAKVDTNCGFAVDDGFCVPGTLEDLADIGGIMAEPMLTLTDIDLADAGARVRDAIEHGARMLPPFESETWPAQRPILDWMARLCEPAESSAYRADLDIADAATNHDALIGRFLATAHGREAARAGVTMHLDPLLWYAAGYGHARPLVWGPMRAEIVLVDWFPRKVVGPPQEAAGFPDLLRAWVQFAHDETDVPAEITDAVLDTIEACEPDFLEQVGDPDRPMGAHALALASLRANQDLDDYDLADLYDHGSWARDTVAHHVGGDHLDDIPLGPLPPEAFNLAGVPDDIVDTVNEYVDHIVGCCTALLDDEYRTACFRLLRRVVDADPSIFRRKARNDRGALALIWIVAQNNMLFDGIGPTHEGGMYAIQVSDLVGYFDAPQSGHTTRADTMLRAIGRPRDYGRVGLGDPALLTAAAREYLTRMRDR